MKPTRAIHSMQRGCLSPTRSFANQDGILLASSTYPAEWIAESPSSLRSVPTQTGKIEQTAILYCSISAKTLPSDVLCWIPSLRKRLGSTCAGSESPPAAVCFDESLGVLLLSASGSCVRRHFVYMFLYLCSLEMFRLNHTLS